ncbi:galactokinase [Demequina sp. SO4-18]|uniref:galactokinase n=1 Tax=Demequina sp. SO4-18 TaxID=3401026 RepID=UPI003B5C8BC0
MGSVQTSAVPPRWVEPWTRGQGDARARALLARVWDGEPDGVWSAPGRVTIIGEHTDYNGGMTLPTVTPHRTYVAARLRDDDRVRIVSEGAGRFDGPGDIWEGTLDGIDPETAKGWPAYVAGVMWALRERGFDGAGLDIAICSCVPSDAGLASSGALSCATARAINALWGLALDSDQSQWELAEACVHAEEAIAGVPAGGLDQHTQLRCREGEAIELDFSHAPPRVLRRPLYFPEYGLALLVIALRSSHQGRAAGLANRVDECRAAARALGVARLGDLAGAPGACGRVGALEDATLRRRARHVLSEIDRVHDVMAELANTGPAHERFVHVGEQLFRSHASLEMDFEVSTPEQNLAVDTAYRTGALGARLIGAGFGGCALAFIRRTQADSMAQRIDHEFIDAGRERPQFLLL